MTKQLVTVIAIIICTATQVHATEYEFVAEDHGPATRFCIAAGEGDIDGLRFQIRKLRQSPHHQYKAIVNSVRCNGQLAAQFAKLYGADDTYEYLYRLTSKQNREQVGRTSVEDVVLGQPDVSRPDVVLVRVSGR